VNWAGLGWADTTEACYRGVLHLHSHHSHDGRESLLIIASTLADQGMDFAVLTDHFEDLDEARFAAFVADVARTNLTGRCLLIPGVEVDARGVHTLVFPVREYDDVDRFLPAGGEESIRIVAHPGRQSLSQVKQALEAPSATGVEIWNQAADGLRMPDVSSLGHVLSVMADGQALFFGVDCHSVFGPLSNVLLVPKRGEAISEALVLARIRARTFVCHSRKAHTFLHGGASAGEVRSWLVALEQGLPPLRRGVVALRSALRSAYAALPRWARHRLNEVKNAVRSRM
jgi:hypothetical protein